MTGTFSLPASRTEVVLEEIRRGILTRELVPGQPLVEAELAAGPRRGAAPRGPPRRGPRASACPRRRCARPSRCFPTPGW